MRRRNFVAATTLASFALACTQKKEPVISKKEDSEKIKPLLPPLHSSEG